MTDIASALTASIAVDGQTTPTANLPMGNFRHLSVANAQNTNEYATVGQIQSAGFTVLGASAGLINTTQSITTTGTISGSNITGTSDERLKEDWRPMARDFLERMAGVLHGTFAWVNGGPRSAGAGAQSMREAFPEVVHEADDGTLSIAYGHAALVTVLELIPLVLRLLDERGETP
jgi:hypothetical protein